MKSKRQAQLLKIVEKREVETQEELMHYLREYGIKVTQATISRDIKELRLAKVPNGRGGYKYSLPAGMVKGDLYRRAKRIFKDYVRSVDHSGQLILIKTYPGGAHAVAAIIDELKLPGMMGSVAGDDSIIVLTRAKEEEVEPSGPTGEVFFKLRELLEG